MRFDVQKRIARVGVGRQVDDDGSHGMFDERRC